MSSLLDVEIRSSQCIRLETGRRRPRGFHFLALVPLVIGSACGARFHASPEHLERESEPLTSWQESRCGTIAQLAQAQGITNPLLLAGIANQESDLAQCYSEYIGVNMAHALCD
jgi:hypothetical protein